MSHTSLVTRCGKAYNIINSLMKFKYDNLPTIVYIDGSYKSILNNCNINLFKRKILVCQCTPIIGVGGNFMMQMVDLIILFTNQFILYLATNGSQQADKISGDVGGLYSKGVFRDGEVVSQSVQAQAREKVRGDKITWVSGSENGCLNIGQLVAVLDAIISTASKHPNSEKIAEYNITTRTRERI
ncbi:unnamed protein product, partial [Meganyctiphanes norvegica]